MMERRFSMNDFEHSLKEHADDFKMIPSKRVWHGIYNDMHPGRRWPSVTMSLLLVFTLVVIGHLNTHNGSQTVNSKHHNVQPNTVKSNLNSGENSNSNQKIALSNKASRIADGKSLAESQQKGVAPQEPRNPDTRLLQNKSGELTSDDLTTQNSKASIQSGFTEFEKNENSTPQVDVKSNTSNDNIDGKTFDYNNFRLYENSVDLTKSNKTIIEKIPAGIENNLQSDHQITIGNINLFSTEVANENKNVKSTGQQKPDDLAKKLQQKKNDKISWVYFVAPQVNSVSFSGQPIRPSNTNNSPAVAINTGNYKVLHNSALGFEAGVQINNSVTRKLWITSGIHITYSGYNITSNEVHPTFANLFLKDPTTGDVYSKSYITHYGNGTGQTAVSIRNYSLQASIPLGLQYEFAGSDKIKFNTYANFEPSMVIKSNAYILSSDGNNYVNDPDLLRKLNMNSNFGAFFAFNSAKFKWQIGPNVRYQWLSTYKKDYPIQEHLIDYGIRIGISPLRK